jgi:hypothetical protein
MQIAEMRTALNRQNLRTGQETLPTSMPDWAVLHVFERRNGLPLTSFPQGVEVRSAGNNSLISARVERAKAIVREHEAQKRMLEAVPSELDYNRLRLAIANLQ